MPQDDDDLSQLFSALANPTRRAILERLVEGEATVNELAEPFEMTLPAISRHISVLEASGLITRGQRAQFRPCVLDARPLRKVATWADQYRQNWEESFDRLDVYLDKIQKEQEP